MYPEWYISLTSAMTNEEMTTFGILLVVCMGLGAVMVFEWLDKLRK